MLRADGQPDGIGVDPLIGQFFFGQLGMRGRCRMDHQALHVRHIGQQGEDLQVVDKSPRLLLTALDLKGKNGGSSIGKISFIQFVVRMVRKGRVIHFGDLRMPAEILDHFLCVFGMPLQAEREGLHSLEKEKCIEGRDGRAGIPKEDSPDVGHKGCGTDGVLKGNSVIARIGVGDLRILPGILPVKLSCFHDDTSQRCSVATQEFSGGVHHDVHAVLDGTDQVRCTEGIIYNERKSVPVRDLRDGIQIRDIAVGISQCLQIDRSGIILNGIFQLLQIMGIHEGRSDPILRECVAQQIEASAINGLLGHDVSSVGGQRFYRVGNGCRTGCQCQSGGAALQGSHSFFQHILCGVGQPSVDISGIGKTEPVRRVPAVMEYIRGGLVNGYRA